MIMAEDPHGDPRLQIEAAHEAFEQDFGRFARFRSGASEESLTLAEAEKLERELGELRSRHLGKKSAIASVKKLIGRVAAEERAALGQLVQQTEAQIVEAIGEAEQSLKKFIEGARVGRESIDVTMPGRRLRRGHLHPITLMRERIEDIFVS
jgi:phenylalanyl-tRNA synthetase alpha chain